MLKKKILVVDDEQDIREIIRFYLEDSGYEVIEASNGKEALELAQKHRPELITLDILMPGMDGFEVIKNLKEKDQTKDIPVIILSVVPENHRYHHAIAEYISKPFEKNALIGAVEKVFFKMEGKQKYKILVVDDEKDIVDVVCDSFEEEGDYVTIKAFSGQEAIEITKKEKPDLILLDLKMPQMSGYDVIKQLKGNEKLSRIPIVVLTGTFISEEDKQKGVKLGAEKYLTKPFSAKELVSQIKESLQWHEKES